MTRAAALEAVAVAAENALRHVDGYDAVMEPLERALADLDAAGDETMPDGWSIDRSEPYADGGRRWSLYRGANEEVLLLPSDVAAGAVQALRVFADRIEGDERSRHGK